MGACEAGAAHVMHVRLVRHDWDLYRGWERAVCCGQQGLPVGRVEAVRERFARGCVC